MMTTTDTNIKDQIRQFILGEFLVGADPEELTDTTPLITGGILDSLGMIKTVAFLEERFGISLDADVAKLATVKDIVDLVQSKI